MVDPRTANDGDERPTLPPIRFRIVAYDYGIKQNILRLLRQKGFGVTVVPATDDRRGSARAESGRNFSLQRPGRSGGACLTRTKPFAI